MTSAQIHPVTLIGGGPGAWDLITVRGMRALQDLSLIHISEPTRPVCSSRMPSSA